MVHGNPSWSYMYRKLVLALRDRYRTLAPDHIGMGRSDAPPRSEYPYDLERRVADFTRFIESLELAEPITLVVHDWGGMIGLAWAVEHPEQVARLVLLNTVAFPLPADKTLPLVLQLARAPYLGELLIRGLNAFAVGATLVGVRRRPMSRAARQGYLAPYGSWGRRVAINQFVQDIPTDPAHPSYAVVFATGERLDRLAAVPTLICWGTKDPVFDLDYLAEWERRLPGAEVHRVDGGHFVLEDAPDVVIPLIEGFLART
ncbi:MAG: alpha/beta fold hydrolase [Acidimicrobiia bacterium]|nr:alpha/beta fold hydrolase [Acidimicrobiia bacterium]